MKKIIIILSIALLSIYGHVVAQSGIASGQPLSTIDSVIYYFDKSQSQSGIDTALFNTGLALIENNSFNPFAIKLIKKYAADLRSRKKFYFSDNLYATLRDKLINMQDYDGAINLGKEIINQYDANRNPDDRDNFLNFLLETRNPYNKSNRLEEGFAFYTPKLKLYLQRNDSAAISSCYYVMGKFYRLKGFYDLAIYNIKKSLAYVDTTNNIEAINTWTDRISFIGLMYIDVGDYQNAISYLQSSMHVRLNRLHNNSNVSFTNLNIAFAKLMLDEPAGLIPSLDTAITIAYQRKDWPSVARGLEMKGFYFLKMNQMDSSEQNLIRCNEIIKKYALETNFAAGVLMPDYYLAQIRVKQNRANEARELLEPDIERLSNFKFEALKEYKLLIELYLQLNDAKSAGAAFQKYSTIQAQIKEEERKNRFLSFETEKKISEAENTIGTLESEKKLALLVRDFIIGIAVLLLFVAGIIFNRFRVTRRQKVIIEKEKKRSDELLLNILPSEVAEELKSKGSAEAKHFDEVTVLFTDFKGFTQLSEKLTPTELIGEINECFSAFDNIMQKHGVEKIKTIGDSYMAAGGLPVANSTHAIDVVNAALDIQKFMSEHLKASPLGRFGGARIGVHTGAVVAGIVGVKKFAYDIWGDTVNTASRMESSGEAGKVNISETTYELVREKFQCEFRGEIEAKGKGNVKMYFVS